MRLRESAAALRSRSGIADAELARGIADAAGRRGPRRTGADGGPPGDAAVRITVSRGPLERRGLMPPGFEDVEPTIVIQASPYARPPAELLERGLA